MSGFQPVQMPDFGATWQRGQAFADQREQNALARMMQMRQFEQQQAHENALMGFGGGLGSTNDEKRMASMTAIMRSGPQGAAMMLPLLQQERDIAAFNGPTQASPAPVAPAAPAGGAVDRIIQVESRGDPNARNPRSTASGVLQITDPMWNTYAQRLNLTPEQRNDPNAQRAVFAAFAAEQVPQLRQALGREPGTGDLYAAWALGPAGVRALAANPAEDAFTAYSRVAGPRAAEQAFSSNPGLLERGLTSGQVLDRLRARVEGGAPAPAAQPAPAAGGGLLDMTRVQRAMEQAARGNQTAIRYLASVAPFIRQETNNEVVPVPDPRSPTGFRYERRSAAVGQAAPAPDGYRPGQGEGTQFGAGAAGRAMAEVERLAPLIAAGNADRADVNRYLSAATLAQTETRLPDGTVITPRLPGYAPGQDWVQQRYGIGQPAPAAAAPQVIAASPAPPSAGAAITAPISAPISAPPPGSPIGQSGMVADPPAPRAAGGVARAPQQAPQAVVTGMHENVSAIRKIDDAIAALNAPAGRNSIGPAVGRVPGVALNYADPQGVSLRALIADIGSLKLHDRSGAAVSASEAPRLVPFIPAITDSPDTVRAKLASFRREYATMLQDQYGAYGPSSGFTPNRAVEDTLNGGSRAAAATPATPNPLNLRLPGG